MTKATPQYLSIAQVATMFGVSAVTVYHWRKGNSKVAPMPIAKTPKGANQKAVYFTLPQITAWAKKHKIEMLANVPVAASPKKPGPKLRAVTSEPAKKAAKPTAKKIATKKPTKLVSVPTKEQEQKAKIEATKAKKADTKPVVKKVRVVKKEAPEAPTYDPSLEDSTASEATHSNA